MGLFTPALEWHRDILINGLYARREAISCVESRPSDRAKVVGLPRVEGLHHRYAWREARLMGSFVAHDQFVTDRG